MEKEFRVNTQTLGAQKNPSIATLKDGSFVVAWEDERKINIEGPKQSIAVVGDFSATCRDFLGSFCTLKLEGGLFVDYSSSPPLIRIITEVVCASDLEKLKNWTPDALYDKHKVCNLQYIYFIDMSTGLQINDVTFHSNVLDFKCDWRSFDITVKPLQCFFTVEIAKLLPIYLRDTFTAQIANTNADFEASLRYASPDIISNSPILGNADVRLLDTQNNFQTCHMQNVPNPQYPIADHSHLTVKNPLVLTKSQDTGSNAISFSIWSSRYNFLTGKRPDGMPITASNVIFILEMDNLNRAMRLDINAIHEDPRFSHCTHTTYLGHAAYMTEQGNYAIAVNIICYDHINKSPQDGYVDLEATGLYLHMVDKSVSSAYTAKVNLGHQYQSPSSLGLEDPAVVMFTTDANLLNAKAIVAWTWYEDVYVNILYLTSSSSTNDRTVLFTGSSLMVNSYTISRQANPAVTKISNNRFVVTWEGYGQDSDITEIYAQEFIIYSRDGVEIRKQGPEFQVNTYAVGVQKNPAVATLTSGDFVVVWEGWSQEGESVTDIFGQRFYPNGTRSGQEFQVNINSIGAQTNPVITALLNDQHVIAWESDGQDGSVEGIYARNFESQYSNIQLVLIPKNELNQHIEGFLADNLNVFPQFTEIMSINSSGKMSEFWSRLMLAHVAHNLMTYTIFSNGCYMLVSSLMREEAPHMQLLVHFYTPGHVKIGPSTTFGYFDKINKIKAVTFIDNSVLIAWSVIDGYRQFGYQVLIQYISNTGVLIGGVLAISPKSHLGLFSLDVLRVPGKHIFSISYMPNSQTLVIQRYAIEVLGTAIEVKPVHAPIERAMNFDYPSFKIRLSESDESVTLVWSYQDLHGIFAKRYDAYGYAIGPIINIRCTPSSFIANADAIGNYVVAWHESGSNLFKAQVFSLMNTKLNQPISISPNGSNQTLARVYINDGFIVAEFITIDLDIVRNIVPFNGTTLSQHRIVYLDLYLDQMPGARFGWKSILGVALVVVAVVAVVVVIVATDGAAAPFIAEGAEFLEAGTAAEAAGAAELEGSATALEVGEASEGVGAEVGQIGEETNVAESRSFLRNRFTGRAPTQVQQMSREYDPVKEAARNAAQRLGRGRNLQNLARNLKDLPKPIKYGIGVGGGAAGSGGVGLLIHDNSGNSVTHASNCTLPDSCDQALEVRHILCSTTPCLINSQDARNLGGYLGGSFDESVQSNSFIFPPTGATLPCDTLVNSIQSTLPFTYIDEGILSIANSNIALLTGAASINAQLFDRSGVATMGVLSVATFEKKDFMVVRDVQIAAFEDKSILIAWSVEGPDMHHILLEKFAPHSPPLLLNLPASNSSAFSGKFNLLTNSGNKPRAVIAYENEGKLIVKKVFVDTNTSPAPAVIKQDFTNSTLLSLLSSRSDNSIGVIWLNHTDGGVWSQSILDTEFMTARVRSGKALSTLRAMKLCAATGIDSIDQSRSISQPLGLKHILVSEAICSSFTQVIFSGVTDLSSPVFVIQKCSALGFVPITYHDSKCLTLCNSLTTCATPSGAPLVIDADKASIIQEYLALQPDFVIANNADIFITAPLDFTTCGMGKTVSFVSSQNIEVTSPIALPGNMILHLKAGIGSANPFTVTFTDPGFITATESSSVIIQYNPVITAGAAHKYHSPAEHHRSIYPKTVLTAYMLVNTCQDLQDINYALSMNYALSQDIDCGVGAFAPPARFKPLIAFYSVTGEPVTFSGALEGNGFSIKNLNLDYSDLAIAGPAASALNDIGLFSRCDGLPDKRVAISNIVFDTCTFKGPLRVGAVCGHAQYAEISNVELRNCRIEGSVLGLATGAAGVSKISHITSDVMSTLTYSVGGVCAAPAQAAKFWSGAALGSAFKTCKMSDLVPINNIVGLDAQENDFSGCTL